VGFAGLLLPIVQSNTTAIHIQDFSIYALANNHPIQ
jgi:hypothetical protein